MKPFLDLTVAGQFRRLREAAFDACRQLSIEVVALKPLNHGENTTFQALDKFGEKHVIRIHRPGYQTFNSIDSELKFLDALNVGTDLNVPKPRKSPTGEHIVEVSAMGVDGSRLAVAFNWLDGRFLDKRVTDDDLIATGKLTASLHAFIENYKQPKGFERRTWDSEFTLKNAEARLGEFVDPEPFFEACTLISKQIEAFGREAEYGLIHADLHFGNVFFTPTGIAAIDFDDLGFAHFAYDYAVTLGSLRKRENFRSLRDAYAKGYENVRPLPKDWIERLEVFMAARLIFMVDWFFTRDDNPRLREYRDEVLPRWGRDLKRYVETAALTEPAT
jgi:Ser/Thr protein kinase RdoA (MazF antagonist)